MQLPSFFNGALWLLLGSAALHFVLIAVFGRLPRMFGWLFTAAYGVFLALGLGS